MTPITSPGQRRFFCSVVLASLVGFALRIYPIGRLGLNQFDEGIYALSASWAFHRDGFAAISPSLIPYAPPGYSILVGLTSLILGRTDQVGYLVSAMMGSLTISVVALITWKLCGRTAASCAAWCLCFSGPHIAFSRMTLTDASFLCAWSLGFLAALRFLEAPGFRSAVALGAFVGLAQQLKYNGWLLGGMVIGTVIVQLLTTRPLPYRLTIQLWVWGLFAATIAAFVVLPWYLFVEHRGGYSALLAHQRSYLGGWAAWWPHLGNQVDQAVALGGASSLIIVAAVITAISGRFVDSPGSNWFWPRGMISIALATGLALIFWNAPLTSGFYYLVVRRPRLTSGALFLCVSWVSLLVLTPFYHPYARLWLPFELFHWVILGALISGALDISSNWRSLISDSRRRLEVALIGLLGLGTLFVGQGFPFATANHFGQAGLFEPSDSLKYAATEISRVIPPEIRSLRTLIRPAMSYYLAERISLWPLEGSATLRSGPSSPEWVLVDSTILMSETGQPTTERMDQLVEPFLDRWELIADFLVSNSLPTQLDLDPSFLQHPGLKRTATFWLLKPRSTERPR